jgi:hypothetical protein
LYPQLAGLGQFLEERVVPELPRANARVLEAARVGAAV